MSIQKLLAVTTAFIYGINTNKKAHKELNNLNQVLCVYYLVLFWKYIGKANILALINSEKKINIMNPASAPNLSLQVQKININIQKLTVSL